MLFPFFLGVGAEVARKGLLAPGAVDGVADGRKCADGLVFAGVTEELTSYCQIYYPNTKCKGKGRGG